MTLKGYEKAFETWYENYLSLPGATPKRAAKAAFRAGHGLSLIPLIRAIDRFNEIIDIVEARCMAVDGPVTPTLQEITEKELSNLWKTVQVIRRQIAERTKRA